MVTYVDGTLSNQNDLTSSQEIMRRIVPVLQDQLYQGDSEQSENREQLNELVCEDSAATQVFDGLSQEPASRGKR